MCFSFQHRSQSQSQSTSIPNGSALRTSPNEEKQNSISPFLKKFQKQQEKPKQLKQPQQKQEFQKALLNNQIDLTKLQPLTERSHKIQRNRQISLINPNTEEIFRYQNQKLLPPTRVKSQENVEESNWDTNYYIKIQINQHQVADDLLNYQQENQNLRAKIMNLYKDNRQMIRQLEGWGMTHQIDNPKPFIDTFTLNKVFTDNGYYSVTLKKEMLQKLKLLNVKEKEFEEITEQIEEFKKESQIKQDIENEGLKEIYVLVNCLKKKSSKNKSQILLEEKMKISKKINLLKAQADVQEFQNEVQQKNNYKLEKKANEQFKKLEELINEFVRLEKLKSFQESLKCELKDIKKIKKNKKEKITQSEELNEKIQEYSSKIERLNIQYQEFVRLGILERQSYLLEIDQLNREYNLLKEQIVTLKIGVIKGEKMQSKHSSDFDPELIDEDKFSLQSWEQNNNQRNN